MAGKVDANKSVVPPPTGAGGATPPLTERITSGVANARDSMFSAATSVSQWKAVKGVRESTVWSWIAWPFRALGSLLGAIVSRASRFVWKPKPISQEVTIEFKGWFWNTTETTSTERALRKGWLTIEQGIADNKFTLDQAQTNGWVPVTIKGRVYNSTMMLKEAVEKGYMTVEQAIADKHITDSQAAAAKWIVKKS